ncbi:MAG TPA: TIGR00730 family Rossman fold protein [Opitutaceae bacterium]|nr:TIGR00730 family Rossman fold protein [Opitutaceae bacterium]
MKSLCVYCASSDRLDPKYADAAQRIGAEVARRGWTLVYGGGKTGLMGAVARGAKGAGGTVVGVIPEFMKAKELAFDEADELITVLTMRERKMLMETRADAFLALPGGWGTLEEIMEILTLKQVDVLQKPVVLFNQDGYYDPLLEFFERMVGEKFMRDSIRRQYAVAPTVHDIFAQLENWSAAPVESKWWFKTD